MYWNKKSVECTFFLVNQPFATPKYMHCSVGKSQFCFNCRVNCLSTNDSKTASNTPKSKSKHEWEQNIVAWFHHCFRSPVSGTGIGTGTGMQRNRDWILPSLLLNFSNRDRNRYRNANHSGMGIGTGMAIDVTVPVFLFLYLLLFLFLYLFLFLILCLLSNLKLI